MSESYTMPLIKKRRYIDTGGLTVGVLEKEYFDLLANVAYAISPCHLTIYACT